VFVERNRKAHTLDMSCAGEAPKALGSRGQLALLKRIEPERIHAERGDALQLRA
jgi:hypothetical protein